MLIWAWIDCKLHKGPSVLCIVWNIMYEQGLYTLCWQQRCRSVLIWAAFRSAVIENVLPWIPVPIDKCQKEQGSRAKQLQVTCTSDHNPGDSLGYCSFCFFFILFSITGCLVSFYYHYIFNANSLDPNQMPHSAVSVLGMPIWQLPFLWCPD